MVPLVGLEPTRGFPLNILSVACIPISPQRREYDYSTLKKPKINLICPAISLQKTF